MKKMLLTAFVLILAQPVFAADDDKTGEYMEQCKTYAQEDGVSADEMDEYLQNCVADMQDTAQNAKD